MPTPPYPIQPEPMEKSWLERNPRWKIPIGALLLIFLVAVSGAVVMTIIVTSFRHTEVYQQAIILAEKNAEVRDQLGEPVNIGWVISGQMKVSGSTGNANLSIPISGPRREGSIHAVAYKAGGVWRFILLQVNIKGGPDVDLLPSDSP